jgi:hypothetical protein
VGVFAANHGLTYIPEFTAAIDYFLNTTTLDIENIQVSGGSSSSVISWETRVPTTGCVRYGESTSYELGQVNDINLVTKHTVTLTDLLAETEYHFILICEDENNNQATSPDLTLTTMPVFPDSGLDDFNNGINWDSWSFINPLGDAEVAAGGGDLSILVPAGATHATVFFNRTPVELVLDMKLDDDPADGLTDSSLYSNDGSSSATHMPNQVAGKIGGACEFDGIDDYVIIPDDVSLDVDVITLAAWIYVDIYKDDQRIISKEFGKSEPYSIYTLALDELEDKKLEFRIAINGHRYRVASNSDIPLNQWTHVAATFDGSKAVLYVNGQVDKTDSSVSGIIQDNDNSVYIGASQFYPRNFDGKIDNVQIYNIALAADEIAALAAQMNPWPAGREGMPPRMMQTVANTDFEIEAKFDSELVSEYQLQGLLAEDDSNNLVAFYVYSDGSGVRIHGASFVNGQRNVNIDEAIATGGPYYLSIRRELDQWTLSYSYDGMTWFIPVIFEEALNVNSAGLFAANHSFLASAPAFTGIVDYFYMTSAPNIGNVIVSAAATWAAISWQTDKPATSSVRYGQSSSYGIGRVDNIALVQQHAVTLTDLTAGTLYHCQILSEDENYHQARTADITFTTNPDLSGIWSDDFNGPELNNSVWTFVNPLSDANFSMNGDALVIEVPADVSHDIWSSGNKAPRLMQAAENADFEIEAKFDSELEFQYQMQGIIVEQDAGNFLRFEVHTDGTIVRVFAASFTNGSPATKVKSTIAKGAPYYLLIHRELNTWTFSYSYDGVEWFLATSFERVLNVTSVGIFAANHGLTSVPAFTGVADYFLNTAMPIEDPLHDPNENTLIVNILGNGSAIAAPDKVTYALGDVVELTAIPDAGWYFAGWSGAVESNDNPATLTITDDHTITALFDQADSNSVINIWYGRHQVFGKLGNPQRWVNILGNLVEPNEIATLTYSLNGGREYPLSVGPGDSARLAGEGDFNIEILYTDLHDGINYVRITATDLLGNSTTQTVIVEYHSGNVWPTTYSIDWSTVTNIQDVVQVVEGLWVLEDGGIRTVQPGYDRLLTIGGMAWDDYEVTIPVTVNRSYHDPNQVGNRPGVGLIMRWTGHYTWRAIDQPRIGWWPMGAIGWFRWFVEYNGIYEIIGNENTKLASNSSPGTPQPGVKYIFKVRCETIPGLGGLYSFKVWRDGDPEPAEWLMTAQESLTDPQNGSILLIAHNADITFGNVTIEPVNP